MGGGVPARVVPVEAWSSKNLPSIHLHDPCPPYGLLPILMTPFQLNDPVHLDDHCPAYRALFTLMTSGAVTG